MVLVLKSPLQARYQRLDIQLVVLSWEVLKTFGGRAYFEEEGP
jgi:hypothetical protein